MSSYTRDAEAIRRDETPTRDADARRRRETPTRDDGEKKVVEKYNFSYISR